MSKYCDDPKCKCKGTLKPVRATETNDREELLRELVEILKYGLDAHTRLQGNAKAQAYDRFVKDGYEALRRAQAAMKGETK